MLSPHGNEFRAEAAEHGEGGPSNRSITADRAASSPCEAFAGACTGRRVCLRCWVASGLTVPDSIQRSAPKAEGRSGEVIARSWRLTLIATTVQLFCMDTPVSNDFSVKRVCRNNEAANHSRFETPPVDSADTAVRVQCVKDHKKSK